MADKRNYELCYKAGLEALNEVQEHFPNLKMILNENDPNVDIMLDIPQQQGLGFDVNLNLQNVDELHLTTGKLWMCWFPCTEKENKEDFMNTVLGLILGKCRILETLKGGKVVKAQLQLSMDGKWVSKSSGMMTFNWPSFRKKSFNIVQNT